MTCTTSVAATVMNTNMQYVSSYKIPVLAQLQNHCSEIVKGMQFGMQIFLSNNKRSIPLNQNMKTTVH